ncbi:MAG: 50S ribosomal protein L30 [Caldilineaceae bacterium]
MAVKTMKITLVRSPIGYEQRQKDTVKALGLRRMHQTIEKPDTTDMRAMVESVRHLVKISE